ncbi:hypothetical protein E2562_003514 [Oryza meyeriana var. granulata]|uniref:BHLH domain-containing protein n=1 Tax=Oryza meyeriana var. granulata TaxID=110450 RepID=A0A6G1CLJ8_9ORYZ|nr:hypothetical protein E2562_003514 [Oryza meyeriana var. granulata]
MSTTAATTSCTTATSNGGGGGQLMELPATASSVIVRAGEAEMASWLHQVLEEGAASDYPPADQPAVAATFSATARDAAGRRQGAAAKGPVPVEQRNRRRDKINEKLRTLQQLVPRSNKPNTSLFVTGTSPFFLGVQLNQTEELRTKVLISNGNNGQLPAPDVLRNSLYTIDIGQNDLTSNLGSESIDTVKQSLPQLLARSPLQYRQELYKIGARNIMVFNMAPIGCYPAFLTKLPHTSNDMDRYGCMKTYKSAVIYYNELLNTSLAEVRKKLQDASIVYVGKHAVTLELFRHPKAHGLKYGTRACCRQGDGAYNFNPDVYCGSSKVLNGQTPSAKACADPQNYVSWDGIHATEAANKIITSSLMRGSYSYPPFDLSKHCRLQPIA